MFTVISAHVDKNNPGDADYWRHLVSLVVGPSVICTQERGRGRRSTAVHGINTTIIPRYVREVETVRAHRRVAAGTVRIKRKKWGARRVRVISAYSPRGQAASRATQALHHFTLALRTRLLTATGRPWVVGVHGTRHWRQVAQMLGGHGVGHGADAVIVSRSLRLYPTTVDWVGKRKCWADHPAIVVSVWPR